MFSQDTIFALATPMQQSAIAVFRLSGENVKLIASRITNDKIDFSLKKQVLDIFSEDRVIDNAVVTYSNNPNSFTGEDYLEVSCHGSLLIIDLIFKELIVDNLARVANPGEFSLRAFKNGKIDLNQAEAINQIIHANNNLSLDSAVSTLNGRFTKLINEISNNVINVIGDLVAGLDFAEEDISVLSKDELKLKISELKMPILSLKKQAENFSLNNSYPKIVLTGSVNSGKSTLFNKMNGFNRAIVSSIKGTTRDYISAVVNIEGNMVEIIDTAGLRETTNEVEAIGINKSIELIESADIVLRLIELNSNEPVERINNEILIGTKKDLYAENENMDVSISVETNENIDKLFSLILDRLKVSENDTSSLVSVRQVNSINKIYDQFIKVENNLEDQEVVVVLLENIVLELNNLAGKDLSEKILENIFSKFCVGK